MSSILEMLYDLVDHEPFWEMINHKSPTSEPKILGKGTKGIAFDVGNNKVIKITKDDTEADASSIVAKKGKVEGINRIYGVYKWKFYPDYYIIVQDKVKMDEKRAKKAIYDIFVTDIKLYPKSNVDILKSKYYTSTRVKEMIDASDNKDTISIIKGLGNLNKLGILYRDLHEWNIGFDKSNNAVIIDLGYSESRGGDVKVFERYNYE